MTTRQSVEMLIERYGVGEAHARVMRCANRAKRADTFLTLADMSSLLHRAHVGDDCIVTIERGESF